MAKAKTKEKAAEVPVKQVRPVLRSMLDPYQPILPFDYYSVEIELIEQQLGTVPKNKKIYEQFIATQLAEHARKNERFADAREATEEAVRKMAAEELATVPEGEEGEAEKLENKGWTGFHADDKGPFLYNYACNGFIREAAGNMREWKESTPPIKQLGSKMRKFVFVLPRRLYPVLPDGSPVGEDGFPDLESLERPVKCETPKGPRVALMRSDLLPVGTRFNFELHVSEWGRLPPQLLRTIFEYGLYQGLGQWRTGGYGTFQVRAFHPIDTPKYVQGSANQEPPATAEPGVTEEKT